MRIPPRRRKTVSIHAPAWGATYSAIFSIVDSGVSIHAPAWGATQWKKLQGRFPTGFNPRTRVGCDRTMECRFMHPPCFNPRTRVGCDMTTSSPRIVVSFCFNPRTRVGCDQGPRAFWSDSAVFQSTHPRGVRLKAFCRAHGLCEFQSTHPRGVRLLPGRPGQRLRSGFNPRTRVGCDARTAISSLPNMMFQSTHPRGVRPTFPRSRRSADPCFNPRTRVGCDAAFAAFP